jgi:Fanconi anemia group M protein
MDISLTNAEPRVYQQVIFSECVSHPGNTLVVLPTGLGKTIIMAYLVAYHLKNNPDRQILILTPTRPLVHQIAEMFVQFITNLSPEVVLEVSGEVPPEKRRTKYPSARIIVGTPQTIENDLIYDRLQVQRIGLLCFDEVHRATGEYAYVGIASQAKGQIIGFTATPGNNPEKILEVCNNLNITKISVTNANDLDVNKYISVHTPKVVWIDLPTEYKSVIKDLQDFQDEIVEILKDRLPGGLDFKFIGKREALGIHQQVVRLTKEDSIFGELLIPTSNLIRVQHLRELVESQGFPQAYQSIQKWRRKTSSKALRLFLEDERVIWMEEKISEEQIVHPKLQHLINEIEAALSTTNGEDSRIIVFSNFRDTVRFLHNELVKTGFETGIFIGHSSSKEDKGLSQKEQLNVIEEFKRGDLRVLISTSVGEEGLDVGNCDLVVFYDSVPSIIRAIQRKGRGRKKQSRVIHLVTKKTRDEAMYWAIKNKDKQMVRFLKYELPQLLEEKGTHPSRSTLDQYFKSEEEGGNVEKNQTVDSPPHIIIDTREASSRLPKLLKQEGARISPSKLEVGDYILSNRLVVELKRYSDFVKSILDGRLFQSTKPGHESQLARLAQQPLPLLIIQFESDALTQSININSIMGAISSIIIDFRIPMVFTGNDRETAILLYQLARREQKDSPGRVILPSVSKKEQNIREIQLFMLSAIPGINIEKAKNLLAEFKTIQTIGSADISELTKVPQIGKKLATRIKSVLNTSGEKILP